MRRQPATRTPNTDRLFQPLRLPTYAQLSEEIPECMIRVIDLLEFPIYLTGIPRFFMSPINVSLCANSNLRTVCRSR